MSDTPATRPERPLWIAAVLASVAVSLVFAAILAFTGIAEFFGPGKDILTDLVSITVVLSAVTILAMALLGAPLIFAMRRTGTLNLATMAIAGALVGALMVIAFCVFALRMSIANDPVLWIGMGYGAAVAVLCGLFGGVPLMPRPADT